MMQEQSNEGLEERPSEAPASSPSPEPASPVAGYTPTAPPESDEESTAARGEVGLPGLTLQEEASLYKRQAQSLWDSLVNWFTAHRRGCYLARTGGWCFDCKWVYDVIKGERGIGVAPKVLIIDPPEAQEKKDDAI